MSHAHFLHDPRFGADRQRMRGLVAELGPDDGVDPRHPPKSSKAGYRGGKRILKPAPKPSRKALQLCGQVMRTLDQALAGLCDDDILRDLYVESVIPAPDESRLLVTVTSHPSVGPVDPIAALMRLEQASGLLRTEVAADITRKRAPNLAFRFAINPGPEAGSKPKAPGRDDA